MQQPNTVNRGGIVMPWDDYFDLERQESNAQAPDTPAATLQELFDTVSTHARELRDEPGYYDVELIPLARNEENKGVAIHVMWRTGSDDCVVCIMRRNAIVYLHGGLRKSDVGLLICHQSLTVADLNEHFGSRFAARDAESNFMLQSRRI